LEQRRHRQAPRRRVRVERVDELADPVDDLDLVRLEVPDEMPAEGVAERGVLPLQILSTVLTDDLDPRLDEDPHVLERNVLGRRPDRLAVSDLAAEMVIRSLHRFRRHVRSSAALASNVSLSFAPGSSSTSSSRTRSTRPISGPSEKPSSIRSPPSTARSPI